MREIHEGFYIAMSLTLIVVGAIGIVSIPLNHSCGNFYSANVTSPAPWVREGSCGLQIVGSPTLFIAGLLLAVLIRQEHVK